jgi:hypothetical protein
MNFSLFHFFHVHAYSHEKTEKMKNLNKRMTNLILFIQHISWVIENPLRASAGVDRSTKCYNEAL